jgi:predicted nucleic acid-binding protein
MSLIYWDSMLFIYYFEGHPEYGPRVSGVLRHMEARGDSLCTSAFTAAEVLAGLHRAEAWHLATRVEQFFHSPELRVLDFRLSTANRYAKIRSQHRVSPADAIHLACAAEASTDLFVTHDQRLKGKFVEGIQFIIDLDTNLF